MGENVRENSASDHLHSYPRFLWHALLEATDGSRLFYAWMTFLTAVALVGVNAWAWQMADGMGPATNMSDHVSWGLYIGNFTFMVGVAAGAVMMVIPAYLYRDKQMHDVVIIGELLAIAAIVMCLLFVTVDLGRPDRVWHMMPLIGRFHWPMSMLTWDVIVLNVYLILNLHICGYILYIRFRGEHPNPKWYVPFVFISILWAISIHTVTAFLYCGLGGRPFWNSALLAPRFLTSAFVSGPAVIIIALQIVRRTMHFHIGDGPIRTMVNILKVTCLLNLFMLFCEIFTEFYTSSAHESAARYLFFGLHGHAKLVPWIWTSILFNVTAAFLILRPSTIDNFWLLNTACVLTFIGVWIEKGMGLIVPGFVPSTLHELVEYVPSHNEWKISAGILAFGLMIYTVALKIAIPILAGEKKDPALKD